MSSTGATGTAAPPAPRPPRRVIVYDFKRPDKFSKDQIRTVSFLHETFARQATAALSSMLRSLAHVHLSSVDQLTYEEFLRSVPNPTLLATISMAPLKGSALIEMDPGVTSAMIDRLFGGTGKPWPANRDLTDIEVGLMEGGFPRLLECLRAAWASILDITPKLGAIETNPQVAQIVAPNEIIVLVSFECRVGDGSGMINLVLPYLTIEPIIPRLSAEYLFSTRRPAAESPLAAAASLPMNAEVCYEGERLSLAALTRLKKGTRVPLHGYGEGRAFLQAGGAPILDLTARRPCGAGRVTWILADQRAERELAALGAGGGISAHKAMDPVLEALQSITTELGAGMKSVEGRISELQRRHEDLADQLLFQSPDQQAISPMEKAARDRPFGFLSLNYCDVLAPFLGQEHPQLVALVLSHLEPALAACVLERIPEEMRTGVTERICTMARVAPEVLRLVEGILEKKLSAISSDASAAVGGIAAAVEILNVVPRGLEKMVVETLERTNPALAEEIKKRMFVFEDILILGQQTMASVLAEVPEDDLLLSLKAASPEVRAFVWDSMPVQKAAGLQARLEKTGPARLLDVDAAQQRIVAVIRRMDEEGKIVVGREGEMIE
jgi:flagellar motor switch protein FliM/flagellar motor switch protein FliG